MGLSGSELRSLVLPLRAGEQAAARLLPSTSRSARQVAAEPRPAPPPIDTTPYRQRELADIWRDIFEDRHGFEARRRFLGVAA